MADASAAIGGWMADASAAIGVGRADASAAIGGGGADASAAIGGGGEMVMKNVAACSSHVLIPYDLHRRAVEASELYTIRGASNQSATQTHGISQSCCCLVMLLPYLDLVTSIGRMFIYPSGGILGVVPVVRVQLPATTRMYKLYCLINGMYYTNRILTTN